MKQSSPVSPYVRLQLRDRRDAALDKAHAALAELLACVELADAEDGAGGVPEDRHQAAKAQARQAIADIQTLWGTRE